MALILVVEDEKLLRWTLTTRLEKEGYLVHAADCLSEAAAHLEAHRPDVVLLDLSLPDGNGLDFFEQKAERLSDAVVVVITAVGAVEDAVRAMKLGAADFLSKPVEHEDLVELVRRSLSRRRVEFDAELARDERERDLRAEVIGQSPSFRETLETAAAVARSEVLSVLVQGESGTGKNVLARYIHGASQRRDRPLLEVSCASIPEQLLESELFGHERGAFTDAKTSKRGTFELADGGTVVLDEVGELKATLQAKLLHVLEERYFRRVGGVREIHVNIRVIALTNRDLRKMVRDGEFREDLYYRLNVFPIVAPPLRSRREDIVPLAAHFVAQIGRRFGRQDPRLSREAEQCLVAYPWPGNIRELRNTIERAMILESGTEITCRSLLLDGVVSRPSGGRDSEELAPPLAVGASNLDEAEKEMVRAAMERSGGNQSEAARLLGISRDRLRYRLKKFGF